MNELELKAAQDLETLLISRLPTGFPQITISTYGSLARVLVSHPGGRRSSTTHSPLYDVPLPEGTERGFLTYFEENGKPVAAGTTGSITETAAEIEMWLHDAPIPDFHDQFKFVDQRKRDLLGIQNFVLSTIRGIEATISVDLKEYNFRYGLWFRSDTRSVMVDGDFMEAWFRWDQSVLFRFKVIDKSYFAAVLKSWLCDGAPPSVLRQLFPNLEIGELADYFERGDPITGEFLQSWNETLQFVGSRFYQGGSLVLPILLDLRQKGFDRKLRVGLAHGNPIIFSRSRYADLREEQPYVILQVDTERGVVGGWTKIASTEKIPELHQPSLSSDIERALVRLVNCEIS